VTQSVLNNDRWRQRMSEQSPASEEEVTALEAQRSDLQGQCSRAGQLFEVDRLDAELDSVQSQINALLDHPEI